MLGILNRGLRRPRRAMATDPQTFHLSGSTSPGTGKSLRQAKGQESLAQPFYSLQLPRWARPWDER